jgi:hypothetical protein
MLTFIRYAMLAEREVLVSLLTLTREDTIRLDSLSREARVPVQVVRDILRRNADLITHVTSSRLVTVGPEQRLKIAIKAIELGADIERVCKSLTWLEFEDISVLAFEINDFRTTKHFRFSWANRRWEIDILGLKEPLVISADCKHWRHRWSGSGSRRAAEIQMKRTRILAEASRTMKDKIGIGKWKRAYLVPVILSLVPANQKFYKDVPIVPVLQLGDFLPQIPAYLEKIAHFNLPA